MKWSNFLAGIVIINCHKNVFGNSGILHPKVHPFVTLIEKTHPEFFFNTDEFITYLGYPVEKHTVITKDGYILPLFRIPFGIDGKSSVRKAPVLLQHGILDSSDDFVINKANQSLGFMIADAGFDVWLGNVRGNKYSVDHTNPKPTKHDFFQFSFDEMAEFDLPAIINYVLDNTGYESLQIVGHSMGTTISFALLSNKPEYNEKVKSLHCMAPVIFLDNIKSIVGRLAPYVKFLQFLLSFIDYVNFLPSDFLIKLIASECDRTLEPLCKIIITVITGNGPDHLIRERLPVYISHVPVGTSTNTVAHYAQIINSKKFQKYNFGLLENVNKYKQISPPIYPLENVKIPVHLYWGQNDLIVSPKDVKRVEATLPNIVDSYRVPDDNYGHIDFLWAKDNKFLLNDYLISKLEKY